MEVLNKDARGWVEFSVILAATERAKLHLMRYSPQPVVQVATGHFPLSSAQHPAPNMAACIKDITRKKSIPSGKFILHAL